MKVMTSSRSARVYLRSCSARLNRLPVGRPVFGEHEVVQFIRQGILRQKRRISGFAAVPPEPAARALRLFPVQDSVTFHQALSFL